MLDENNNIIPLNKYNYEITDDEWGDDVGFSASLKKLLKVPADKHCEAIKHIGWSFGTTNGEALTSFPVPMHGNMRDDVPTNDTFPTCSMLHFDAIPVRCFQSMTLQQFASSRLGREDSRDR